MVDTSPQVLSYCLIYNSILRKKEKRSSSLLLQQCKRLKTGGSQGRRSVDRVVFGLDNVLIRFRAIRQGLDRSRSPHWQQQLQKQMRKRNKKRGKKRKKNVRARVQISNVGGEHFPLKSPAQRLSALNKQQNEKLTVMSVYICC